MEPYLNNDQEKEKQLLEREALQTKAHLRAILDNLPALAWLKDRTCRFISVNKRFEEACGRSNEELIGKTDFDIWPADLAAQYRRDDEEVMQYKLQKNVEELVADQKGGVWFETFKTPIYDQDGNVIGITGITRDITARKLLEQQLEQQKLFLKAMMDAIPDQIFYKNREGVFLGCNKAFAQFYGGNEENIIGRTDLDLIKDKALADLFQKKDIETMTSGQTLISEETVAAMDGSLIDTETVKTPFYDEQGNVSGLIGIARDITQRRHYERQMKEQKEFAEMLLGTVPSAVFSVDRDQKVTSWNRMAEMITGYTADEMIGQDCHLFAVEPCTNKCGLYAGDVIKPVINRKCTIRTKQGEILNIAKNVDVLKNETGEVIGGIECFDDVTKKLRMEGQLRESEEKYAAIVNSAPEFITIHKQGKIVFVNQAVTSVSGYSKEDFIDHNILDYLTEGSRDKVLAVMAARSTGNQSGDYEIEFITKSGQIINLIVKTTMITYENELASLVLLVDITDQKRAEVVLRESEERFRNLFEYSPIAYQSLDETGCLIDMNPELCKLLGYSREELLGRQFGEFWAPESRSFFSQDFARFKQEGNILAELQLVKNDKTPITVVLEGRVQQNLDGEFIKTHCILYNITERKRMEDELLKTKEQAEAANISKSQFLANMSHEIRTPMNGIIGFMDILDQTALTEEQREYVRDAKSASETLLYLINDILDFSKIEAGKLSMENIGFRIQTAVEKTVSIHEPKAAEKQIVMQTMIRAGVPEEVYGDPARLRQILNNLLSNAVKFTSKGEIDLIVEAVEFKEDQVCLKFEVRDTGIGIGEEDIAKLFKPFVQADASTTRKYGGTGLGLAISKELAEKMNGGIGVHSVPGHGSNFYFTGWFKVADPSSKGTPEIGSVSAWNPMDSSIRRQPELNSPASERPLIEKQPQILLVEDNEINRKVFTSLLKRKGMTCDIAMDGKEAVEAVGKKEYDIIFMDCQMPVMDGYEATRRIRTGEGHKRHTPIIAMTANAMQGDREKCLAAEMDEYISKPVDVALLFQLIDQYGKAKSDTAEKLDEMINQSMKLFMDQTGISGAESQELFSDFTGMVSVMNSQLENAVKNGDFGAVRGLAHQLKGSAANLRMDTLASLAKAVEIAADANDREKCMELLKRLQVIIE